MAWRWGHPSPSRPARAPGGSRFLRPAAVSSEYGPQFASSTGPSAQAWTASARLPQIHRSACTTSRSPGWRSPSGSIAPPPSPALPPGPRPPGAWATACTGWGCRVESSNKRAVSTKDFFCLLCTPVQGNCLGTWGTTIIGRGDRSPVALCSPLSFLFPLSPLFEPAQAVPGQHHR